MTTDVILNLVIVNGDDLTAIAAAMMLIMPTNHAAADAADAGLQLLQGMKVIVNDPWSDLEKQWIMMVAVVVMNDVIDDSC